MIENTCMRPVFSYNKIREKDDGVSKGPLVLVLDNIIIKIDKFTDIKAHFLDTKTARNETD